VLSGLSEWPYCNVTTFGRELAHDTERGRYAPSSAGTYPQVCLNSNLPMTY
jgi:hypothetical protein